MSKYSKYNLGQIEALINKLGGEEVVDSILEGKSTVNVADAMRVVFDRHGRAIPRDLDAYVQNPDQSRSIVQPRIDYSGRLSRLRKFFPPSLTFPPLEEFLQNVARIHAAIESDARVVNCLRGPWLPLCLPRVPVDGYTKLLGRIFMPALRASYREQFPLRDFIESVVLEPSALLFQHPTHKSLVEKLEEKPVVGIFLPLCLQGFSIEACREFVNTLPGCFHLSGALETMSALVAYPDVLAPELEAPSYLCAAVSWAGRSLNFSMHIDEETTTDRFRKILICALTEDSSRASVISSGGLFITL